MPRGWYLAALLLARSLASMLHGWSKVALCIIRNKPTVVFWYYIVDDTKGMEIEATSSTNELYAEKRCRVYSVRKLARRTYNGWRS
jgi:hypothetical protein